MKKLKNWESVEDLRNQPWYSEEDEEEEEVEEEGEVDDPKDGGVTPPVDDGKKTEPPKGDEKVYEFGGKQLSADELHEKALDLQRDHTQKSQRLAELEKDDFLGDGKKREEEEKDDDKEWEQDDEAIADSLMPVLKKKYGLMTREEMTQEKNLDVFKGDLNKLKGKKDEGYPALDEAKLISWMSGKNPKGVVYNLKQAEEAYRDMNFDDIVEAEIKKRAAKKGGYETETKTGASPKKGEDKPDLSTDEGVDNFVKDILDKKKEV